MRPTLLDLPPISGLTTQCPADPDEVALDFARVGSLTAAELGRLVGLHMRLRARGQRLTIQNVRPEVQEIFQITGLTGVLSIRPAAEACHS